MAIAASVVRSAFRRAGKNLTALGDFFYTDPNIINGGL
jgi:hypothetical protein